MRLKSAHHVLRLVQDEVSVCLGVPRLRGVSTPTCDSLRCCRAHKAFPRPTLLPFGDSSHNPLYDGQGRHTSCHSNHTAAYEELPHRLSWDCLRSYHMTPFEPPYIKRSLPYSVWELRLCTGLSVLPLLTSHHVLELR